MSWVNLCELYYLIKRKKGSAKAHSLLTAMKNWPVTLIPAAEKEALAAGELKADYRISLADAFAAATAILHECPLVNSNPEFIPRSTASPRTLKGIPHRKNFFCSCKRATR
ncbi:MAG: PIN domain-containing protein [Candidatus Eremiobacteraeota bacterium]|nr:PIN domain-containing protein [Candidatus Eremiobacteraeota bacterium]